MVILSIVKKKYDDNATNNKQSERLQILICPNVVLVSGEVQLLQVSEGIQVFYDRQAIITEVKFLYLLPACLNEFVYEL